MFIKSKFSLCIMGAGGGGVGWDVYEQCKERRKEKENGRKMKK